MREQDGKTILMEEMENGNVPYGNNGSEITGNNSKNKGDSFPPSVLKSKKLKQGHRYGLKSVRSIAKRYGLTMDISVEKGMFCVTVENSSQSQKNNQFSEK